VHEIDVHHCTIDEALKAFVETYNRRVAGRQPFRIIHGYGSSGTGGAIKRKLHAFLMQNPAALEWVPGENVDGNPGHTLIYPKKALPTEEDALSNGIVEYCSVPRTESKIMGEFRRHGQPAVKAALRKLLREARLQEVLKAGHTCFVVSRS
jgi:hypothetical protein